jgi:hypothetical protein
VKTIPKPPPCHEDEQGDTTIAAHGLDCPNCDGGTLSKRASARVAASMKEGGTLGTLAMNTKFIYVCDKCEYLEEVVREASDE